MVDKARSELPADATLIAVASLALYAASRHSYLLFHGLVEVTTVAVGFALFILATNARRFLPDDRLQLLGVGYGAAATIDLVHTLAYKGMGVFPGASANLPTQLWIAARALQATTLVAAPALAGRRIDPRLLVGGFAAAVAALVTLVFAGRFPDCWVEGRGLTPFKIASEYVITAVLLGALVLHHRTRARVDARVHALVVASILCSAGSELSFTAYVSVYGFANMLGHLLRLAAYFLLYRALLVTGFREPFELIFRDLKRAEAGLRDGQARLERDVEERTAEVRASEERYRALIRQIQAAVVVHGPDTRILTSNAKAQELLGLSEDQLAGKAAIDPGWCFFQEDGAVLPLDAYPVSRVLRTRRPLRDFVARVHRPSQARDVWVLVNADPVVDARGDLEQIVVTFVDLTERKRAEQEILRMTEQLEARVAERTAEFRATNAELEAFAYSVSHDLRAPLRHVDGYLGLLRRRVWESLDAQSRHCVTEASDAARRMGTLIDDLLSFSRMGRAEMARAPIDMGALVREVVRELDADRAGRRVTWRIAELPEVAGDRAMLRVAWQNLVQNALKFTRTRPEAVIEIGALPREGAEQVFFVRDNGVGFDARYADQLFGVFRRLHRAEEFEGTGIGLANVRRVVARHGGRTWAEGAVGRGAAFFFSLPLVRAAATDAARRPEGYRS